MPNLYKYGTSKIKNKGVRKVLESDIANYAVTEAQNRAKSNMTIFPVESKKNCQGNQ